MVKVKVCAVFDDGSNLVKRTHFLLPQDGTIGDAVNCFQKYHAQTLWAATDGVDLVGILAEKDLRLPYGEAFPSLTHPDFKLEDMMEPNDFLVLRSAAGTGGASEPVPSSAAGRARDEGEVESGRTKRDEAKDKEAKPKAVISEEVRSAHPGGSEHTPAPDGEVESGEAVARMPTRDEKVKTGETVAVFLAGLRVEGIKLLQLQCRHVVEKAKMARLEEMQLVSMRKSDPKRPSPISLSLLAIMLALLQRGINLRITISPRD